MRYSSGSISKFEYAKFLAACLSYFSRRQRDRVGLVTLTDRMVDFVPASAKHLDVVLHGAQHHAVELPAPEHELGV